MANMTVIELKKKPDKERWLSDEPMKGCGQLVARQKPSGKVTFYFRYTHKRKQSRHLIGVYDSEGDKGLTLKQARKKAGECRDLYLSGVADVKGHYRREAKLEEAVKAAEEARIEAERREDEARLTVNELFNEWEKRELSGYKDCGEETIRIFNKDVLPVIGHLYADTIRKKHIFQITDVIEGRGAKRLPQITFSSLRRMFGFAVARDLLEFDPTSGIRESAIGGKNVERDRVLSEEEINLLGEKLKDSGMIPKSQAAILICLSTLCRIGELSKAEWKDIDLGKRVWSIPAENSKNGEAIDIYLTDFTLVQFNVIKSFSHNNRWLFPNRSGDSHICPKTITKQTGDRQRTRPMKKRSRSTGVLCLPGGKWTPHDLRRTGATLMESIGIKPVVIDRCQNHKEPNKVRRTYQRYKYTPEMQHAWELLSERIKQLLQGSRAGSAPIGSNACNLSKRKKMTPSFLQE